MKPLTETKYHETLAKTFKACGTIETKLIGDWMDARHQISVSEAERAEIWRAIEALRAVRVFASKTLYRANVEI